MISGTDISIPTRAGSRAVDLALRVAMRIWPRAVFENATSGTRYERYAEIPLDTMAEVLIYRDAAAAEFWDRMGASPELAGTLIHLLLDDDSLTIVIDDEISAHLMPYVKTVGDALRQDIFNADASRRAA